MKYVQIQTADPVIDYVTSSITSHLLLGERVVWLLSGGSAIAIEVRIAQVLQTQDTTKLYIGLIDERYGPLGHGNENYTQLTNASFPLPIARVLRGDAATTTAETFGAETEQALRSADFSLGIFGMGADGHTAGIKPGSPSITNTKSAIYYEWDDHQRITLTPPTICQLDEAVLYAVGNEKSEVLHTLLYTDTPIAVQPAQILKSVKTSTLYSDVAL